MSATTTSIRGCVWANGKQTTPALMHREGRTVSATPSNRAKQDRNRRNKRARAEVNATFKGETGSKRATEYHARLASIAMGNG